MTGGGMKLTLPMVSAGPIEVALRKLPILPEREHRLPVWVTNLRMILARDAFTTLDAHGRTGRQGPHHMPRPGQAAAELRQVATQIAGLMASLQSLSVTALKALDDRNYEVFGRLRDARGLLGGDAILAAIEAIADKLEGAPARRGKPRDVASQEIAVWLGHAFTDLTGRAPAITVREGADGAKAGGYFLGLVADIFTACGIEASPETYARAAVAQIKRNRGRRYGGRACMEKNRGGGGQ